MAAHAPPVAGERPRATGRDRPLAWPFLLPATAYLVALVAVPAVLTVLAAFSVLTVGAGAGTRSRAGTGAVTAVLRSAAFWRALGTTLLVTAGATVLAAVFGTLLAHLLRARFRGRWPVRFAALLPWTTPAALSATSWRWLLDSPGSPAAHALRGVGLLPGGAPWDARPAVATAVVVAVHAWRATPLAAVIVLAGLAAIPREIRDAARLDGAGPWRRAFGVTLPLTLPAIGLATLAAALVTATDMTLAYALTRGGPGGATRTLPTLSYALGVEGGAPARGAAAAVLLLPVPAALVAAWWRVRRRLRPEPPRPRPRPGAGRDGDRGGPRTRAGRTRTDAPRRERPGGPVRRRGGRRGPTRSGGDR